MRVGNSRGFQQESIPGDIGPLIFFGLDCQEFVKKLREKDNNPSRLPTESPPHGIPRSSLKRRPGSAPTGGLEKNRSSSMDS